LEYELLDEESLLLSSEEDRFLDRFFPFLAESDNFTREDRFFFSFLFCFFDCLRLLSLLSEDSTEESSDESSDESSEDERFFATSLFFFGERLRP
jgi:hypothetical protein